MIPVHFVALLVSNRVRFLSSVEYGLLYNGVCTNDNQLLDLDGVYFFWLCIIRKYSNPVDINV